uniref:hypothetical protein n=1 Tax=Prosthecobacter sp. TaxID=1965333 RepID=UPI003784B29B
VTGLSEYSIGRFTIPVILADSSTPCLEGLSGSLLLFYCMIRVEDMPADSFEGRFAGMLPPKPADEKTRQMGKMLLEAMGVKVTPLKGR